MEKIKKHLEEPAYMFPEQFSDDIKPIILDLLTCLSSSTPDPEEYHSLMTRSIGDHYLAAHKRLLDSGSRIEFNHDEEITAVRIVAVKFTYGPYPVPHNYIAQPWPNMVLMIPKEYSVFESYRKQKEIRKQAEEAGVYIRINVQVTFKSGLEFVVWDDKDLPVIRDWRKRVDFQFVSPHFTPWDEIFELTPDGTWQLKFEWRVSDIDYLLYNNTGN